MWPDRVSNPGPPTYESGALPIALRGPAGLRRTILLGNIVREGKYLILWHNYTTLTKILGSYWSGDNSVSCNRINMFFFSFTHIRRHLLTHTAHIIINLPILSKSVYDVFLRRQAEPCYLSRKSILTPIFSHPKHL